ncbi:MAG: AAA family ATPase [Rhodobacteraceae bacterium]|nr:AAA family ATPase [Paracoccaceae bacterium]
MLRQRHLVLGGMAAALALGLLHILTAPRVYMAETQVMIGEDVAGVGDGFSRALGQPQNEVMLESALQVLQSQTLAMAVVKDLNLHENPAFMSPPQSLAARIFGLPRTVLGAIGSAGSGSGADPDPAAAETHLQMLAAAELRDSIVVRREGRSSVFMVRFTSTDPELVAAVANAYGEAFVSDQLIGKVEASSRVLDWLQNRLFIIQDTSSQAALRAEEFRARSGLETIDGASITVQMIAQLNTDLATATVELVRTRALDIVYSELLKLDPEEFIRTGAAGVQVSDAAFSAGQERLLSLQQRLEEAELRNGPEHSEVLQLRERIATEGRALQREMQRLHETTINAVRARETEIAMLRDSIAEIADQNRELATARVELRAMEQQAEIYEALNEAYLLRLKDLEQTQTFPVTNVRVLSFADVPTKPIAPRKSVILLAMLVLGALGGAALALWQERTQKFIRTRKDLQAASGLPFLGYLPMIEAADLGNAADPDPTPKATRNGDGPRKNFKYEFAALKKPLSQFTETLRNIRVILEGNSSSTAGYVLGVASIMAGEGKTTTAENLAALIAASGRSVLLIDADVRTSALSQKFGQVMGTGLREVLQGRVAWEEALRREQNTGLHFLPSTFGPQDAMAGDLVGAPDFRTLINEARRRYAFTIIDLAPLGLVSDARALVPVLNGLVMIAEWGRISQEMLQTTLSEDPLLYEKLLGIALNKTDMKALVKYSGHQTMEGQGYGYGVQET